MSARATKFAICFLLSFVCLFNGLESFAQCTIPLNNGKSVTFKFTPVSVIVPGSCAGWGYNYDYKIQYTASVAGGPVTFNWVGGTFQSGVAESFSFGLDNSKVASGSGLITTTNNQGRSANDCATATPTSLNIRNLVLAISSSEGSPTVSCAFSIAAPLPVKLLSFDAAINKNKVDVSWVTATETDNAYFILERSADAQTWEDITKMGGVGTTHYNTTYNYQDEMPAAGINYYRLKQVDANGSSTYSRVLAVKAEETSNAIGFYPNPNTGDEIHFTGMQNASDWSVKVVNTSSSVVYQSASMTEQVSLPGLNAGLYFIQMQNTKTGATQTLKMMKK